MSNLDDKLDSTIAKLNLEADLRDIFGTDLSTLTSAQVAHLTPEELTPHLQAAYKASHGTALDETDLKAALDMVRQGHWVLGLPARNPHPDGPEAELAAYFGEKTPVLCHHDQDPSGCDACYKELRQLKRRR